MLDAVVVVVLVVAVPVVAAGAGAIGAGAIGAGAMLVSSSTAALFALIDEDGAVRVAAEGVLVSNASSSSSSSSSSCVSAPL